MDKDAKQTCKHIVKGSHVMIKQQFKWLYKSQFKIFTSFRCPFKKKLKKKKNIPEAAGWLSPKSCNSSSPGREPHVMCRDYFKLK